MKEWGLKKFIWRIDEILVEVQNVSKRFCKDFKRSIRYGFMDSLRALAGKNMDATTLRNDEFWAVKDISFTAQKRRMPRTDWAQWRR